jgi:2-polyprenyl-6-methoxyphenol hydroxylase-like FAD-dependent oxidoreductase
VTPAGVRVRLGARLVVAADGRESRMATLAGAKPRAGKHNRFHYLAYFSDVETPPGWAKMWQLEPDVGFALPTDAGLTEMAYMGMRDELPEWKRDPAGALIRHLNRLPEGPPISREQLQSAVIGKTQQTCFYRPRTHRGMAFIGDAALASDTLWGVGCGFAFQSAEWFADCVGEALVEGAPLSRPLARYSRLHRREWWLHEFFMRTYATGRSFWPSERLAWSGGARDPWCAERVDAVGSRIASPASLVTPRFVARAAMANLRSRNGTRPRSRPVVAS